MKLKIVVDGSGGQSIPQNCGKVVGSSPIFSTKREQERMKMVLQNVESSLRSL